MLAMSARSSLRGPASGGHGSAGRAADRPAHGRPEIPGLAGPRLGPVTCSGWG